jgi:hypothetical protein
MGYRAALFAEIDFLAGNVERAVELATTLTSGASIASPFWLAKNLANGTHEANEADSYF